MELTTNSGKIIFLIKPEAKQSLPMLSLMKLSTYHKKKGDTVHYFKGLKSNLSTGINPDIIYISSVFTWEYDELIKTIKFYKYHYKESEIMAGGICATLMADKIEKETGIKVHRGVYWEIETMKPDYDLYPESDMCMGFTTRGCIRKCGFCMVWKNEPEFIEIEKWDNCLDDSKERVFLLDNNFTASSKEHFDRVIDRLMIFGKPVDFNQSVDCRIITEYQVKRFSQIKIQPMRFSFDGMHEDKVIQNAITMCHKYGIKDIVVDVLYNFTDTPEDLYYRLSELNKLKATAFPMMYQDLTKKERNVYIGKHWDRHMIKNFKKFFNTIFVTGSIGQGCKHEKFKDIFGHTKEEFVKLLKLPDITQHLTGIDKKYPRVKKKEIENVSLGYTSLDNF